MADDYDKQYFELIKSLELIETSLKRSILELEGLGIGPNDSLFDSEGYPRGDIDLYRVRSLRSSIARQQNDHKEIMKSIESILPKIISSSNATATSFNSTLKPFAKIGIVPVESPAFKAGLCPNDLIVKFGNLTKESYANDLKSIASEFNKCKSDGIILEIKVKRLDSNEPERYKSFTFDCKVIDSIGFQLLPL